MAFRQPLPMIAHAAFDSVVPGAGVRFG